MRHNSQSTLEYFIIFAIIVAISVVALTTGFIPGVRLSGEAFYRKGVNRMVGNGEETSVSRIFP